MDEALEEDKGFCVAVLSMWPPTKTKTTPPPAPLKWSLSSTDKQNLLKIMAEYSPTLSDDGEKVKLDEKIVFDEEMCEVFNRRYLNLKE